MKTAALVTLTYPRLDVPFVEEWCAYHAALGFDRIFLGLHVNDASVPRELYVWPKRPWPEMYELASDEQQIAARVRAAVRPHRTTVLEVPRTVAVLDQTGKEDRSWADQKPFFQAMLGALRGRYEWVFVQDTDEFLVPDRVETLARYLSTIPEDVTHITFGQVVCEGRWDAAHRPQCPVLDRIGRIPGIVPQGHGVKSAVRASAAKRLDIHRHEMRCGRRLSEHESGAAIYHYRGIPPEHEVDTGYRLPIAAPAFTMTDDRPRRLFAKNRTAAPSTERAPIAYLILAHHAPAHLARLVGALDDDGVHFFVHVDRKSSLSDFQGPLSGRRNVHFLRRRVSVHHRDLSMVRAELRLLEAAMRRGPSFERYCLLSGADYPIKDRRQIAKVLRDESRELIRVDRALTGPSAGNQFGFVSRFHVAASRLAPFARSPVPLVRALPRVVRGVLKLANLALAPRAYPAGLVPYHGSQWWCLTDACARYVLELLRRHPGFLLAHQLSACPDEVVFHSIIKASPFAANVSHDFERGSAVGPEHGAHYVDWTTPGVPQPKVLDEGDLGALRASTALFARKFDEVASKGLLAALDEGSR